MAAVMNQPAPEPMAAPQPAESVTPNAPIKKGKAAKAPKTPKKPKAAAPHPHHPAWAEMIVNAVKALGEKGGSSVNAIKKYLVANYKIDGDKAGPFMKRGIKAAIDNGQLIQAKGKGLTGSLKLGSGKKPLEKKEKAKKAGGVKKAAGKKKAPATPKKSPAKPKKKAEKAKKAAEPKATEAAAAPANAPAKEAPKKKTPAKAAPKRKVPKKANKAAGGTPKKGPMKTKKAPKTPKAPKPKKAKAPNKA